MKGDIDESVFDDLDREAAADDRRARCGREERPPSPDEITEDAAAQLFADRYEGRVRFCHDTGAWFTFTGGIWRQNRHGLAFHYARMIAREMSRDQKAKAKRPVVSAGYANGVERFCRCDPVLAVTSEVWDADPMLLGTPSGTVDLRTGRLEAGRPEDGITKMAAVAPAVTGCPLWLKFLDEATGGDAELVAFLKRWCGYALTGLTREHALVFVYGPGGNGKSVFINVLMAILGDYAVAAAMDTFTAASGEKHPTDLAMLRGARLVTASETEEGRPWAEARIKQLTGGDRISARFMRQDFFTFVPAFKLTIVGNHQPALRNVDDAARRRFNIVPFTRKPARPDPDLEAKLKAEWPAILQWMIEGALEWQANGLGQPASVAAATAEYFSEQDMFRQWLEAECELEPGNPYKWEKTADLFASWSAFAKAAGEAPGTTKGFGPALRRFGIVKKDTKHAKGWQGVRLRLPADDR